MIIGDADACSSPCSAIAINSDPKHLPTAVLVADDSEFTRSFVAAHAQHGLFRHHRRRCPTSSAARPALRHGRGAVRARHPARISRATWSAASAPRCWSRPTPPIPSPTGNADRGAATQLAQSVLEQRPDRAAREPARRRPAPSSVQRAPRATTPRLTQYNIVPGPDGRDPDDDDGDDDRAWRSRASASAARWRTCSRRRCVPLEVMTRQDRALHRDRLDPGHDHPAGRAAWSVRRADARQLR